MNKIYTRNEAAQIVELFENVLNDYDITVPSPEDDDREPDNKVALYRSVYFDLLDDIENYLIDMLNRSNTEIITGVSSDIW